MSGDQIFKVSATDRPGEFVPLAGNSVPAGFPSPAEDYIDRSLDFNELLVENPAATFAVKIAGESMTGAGLFPQDLAIVNRAKSPINGSIILAIVSGEFTIKRYRIRDGRITLQAENPAYPNIEIGDDSDFEVFGVVTHTIRTL
jgi:DNA polymerase V